MKYMFNMLHKWSFGYFEMGKREWMSLEYERVFKCCTEGHLEVLKWARENGDGVLGIVMIALILPIITQQCINGLEVR